jgi:hypothetical protein
VVDPTALKRPANGAVMPPKLSHGEAPCRVCSACLACAELTGFGPLPPSMYTRPERSLTPGRPSKSHVAYAVVIDPPSEWPPRTTRRPSFPAAVTTRCRSSISTRIPHRRANATSASGMSWKWVAIAGSLR